MPALREVQALFRGALLGGSPEEALRLIGGDVETGAAGFDVYQNNIAASLAAVLTVTFPAMRRLLGEGFFAYATHEFIASQPPRRACLAEYGGEFPAFLAAFAPCRDLAYLADAAQLEWLVHQAASAPDASSVEPSVLAPFDASEAPRLVFTLLPSLGYIASPWPIERIWSENRACGGDVEGLKLDEGGVSLEIGRRGTGVFVRQRPPGDFVFRAALKEGSRLDVAIADALAADPAFVADRALRELFRERAIAAVTLPFS